MYLLRMFEVEATVTTENATTAFLEPLLKLDLKALAHADILRGQVHRSPHVFTHTKVLVFLKTQSQEQ